MTFRSNYVQSTKVFNFFFFFVRYFFERIIELCEQHENLYGAIGIHPEEINSYNQNSVELIKKYLKHPKVVAVGEIGLDYYWDKSQIERQKEILDEIDK